MKIVVNITIDRAIMTGLDNAGEHMIDVTAADLQKLNRRERASLSANTRKIWRNGLNHSGAIYYAAGEYSLYYVESPDFAGLAQHLRAMIDSADKKAEADKAENDRRIAVKEARLAAWLGGDTSYFGQRPGSLLSDYQSCPSYALASERIAAEKSAYDAAEKQAAAEKVEAERAHEQAKLDYIAEFVSTSGTDSERSRFAAGLLCRDTIIERIDAAAFDAAGCPAQDSPYACENRECKSGFKSITCLDEKTFAEYERLSELGLRVHDFERGRDCLSDCDNEESYGPAESSSERVYATVTLNAGPFRFYRAVRLS